MYGVRATFMSPSRYSKAFATMPRAHSSRTSTVTPEPKNPPNSFRSRSTPCTSVTRLGCAVTARSSTNSPSARVSAVVVSVSMTVPPKSACWM